MPIPARIELVENSFKVFEHVVEVFIFGIGYQHPYGAIQTKHLIPFGTSETSCHDLLVQFFHGVSCKDRIAMARKHDAASILRDIVDDHESDSSEGGSDIEVSSKVSFSIW